MGNEDEDTSLVIERTVAPVVDTDAVKEVVGKPKNRASTKTAEAMAQGLEFGNPAMQLPSLHWLETQKLDGLLLYHQTDDTVATLWSKAKVNVVAQPSFHDLQLEERTCIACCAIKTDIQQSP